MASNGEIPIEITSRNQPTHSESSTAPLHPLHPLHLEPSTVPPKQIKRRKTVLHRVRESLTTRVSQLICAILLGILLIIGVITFILWISQRPHRPKFHVRGFSLPALAQENGLESAHIWFDVTVRNPNHNIGIYYQELEGLVYYRDQSIGTSPALFPFYQPGKNTSWIHGELSGTSLTISSEIWTRFMADREAGSVFFRLEMTAMIRFKKSTWNTKHKRMHASCEVGVGQDGLILPTSKDKRCSVYF